MATELKNIKRKFETAEASLSLLAKQWGYGEDTRRVVVCEDDGSTKRYYWDSTRLADQTTSYGTALIGTPGITGITPSGGSSGAAATLQAMLTGLAGTGNGNFIQNGTTQQTSSNFNITGTGVIGTSLGIGLTPSTPLHVSTAFSTGVEMVRLQTATGAGAAGDYLSINSRHWQPSGSGTNAGASIRFTSVDPDTGVRTAKVGLYGSNNESPTLGLEVGPTGAVTIPQAATLSSTLLLTGVGTFTSAPIFNSVTASEFLLVDGSKSLTSVAGTGSGSVMRAVSPTTTGTLTAAAATLSGALTLSTLSAGRIPIVSTAGLIAQDNLYWDATNDWIGVGATASTPSTPLHLTRSFSTGAEMIRLQTASGTGAAGDYLSVNARHWLDSGAGTFAGGSIRFTSVNPATGVRDSKVGLYGSNNEVQTLGLEVAEDGVVTVPVSLSGSNATVFVIRATTAGAPLELHTDTADIIIRPNGVTRATFPVTGGLVLEDGPLDVDGAIEATSIKLGAGSVLEDYEEGSFTLTQESDQGNDTDTAYYTRIGNTVHLSLPALQTAVDVADADSLLSGVPVALYPITNVTFYCEVYLDDGASYSDSVYPGAIRWDGTSKFRLSFIDNIGAEEGKNKYTFPASSVVGFRGAEITYRIA